MTSIAALADTSTAVSAFVLATGLMIGYIRLAGNEAALVRHFALSQVLITGSYAWRTIYWDAILPTFVGEAEAVVINASGGAVVNVVFNLVVMVGAYHGLKALHLMIPERDRTNWSWLTAPLYPPRRLTLGLMLACRAVQRLLRRDR